MDENKSLEKLITTLSEGDKDALSGIYDILSRLIYSVSLGITGNIQDAEDALQETMIDIVKYAHSYKPGTNPRAWILTIARHNSLDIIRRRREHLSIDGCEASMIADTSDLSTDIKDLLRELDDGERQIIILRVYAELSYSEIAKIMKISVFAAQKRYQRVLKKLKKYYGGVF